MKYLKFNILIIMSFVLHILYSVNYTKEKFNIPIKGVWICKRPPYGTDSLIISDDTYYMSIADYDTQHCHIGIIKYYNTEKGQIKVLMHSYYKNKVKNLVKKSNMYIIFELSENELWTYSNHDSFPNYNYLKINAYRNSWENTNFEKYSNLFYSKIMECDTSETYSVYHFQDDIFLDKFVTIPPKIDGGNKYLKEYFNKNLVVTENIDNVFMKINIKFKVDCYGKVVDCIHQNGIFPNLTKELARLITCMKNFIPAVSKYKHVPCYSYIEFTIKQGKIYPYYRYN